MLHMSNLMSLIKLTCSRADKSSPNMHNILHRLIRPPPPKIFNIYSYVWRYFNKSYSICFTVYVYIYIYSEGLGVAFFATGPGLGLIMYILTTLEFPTHYFDFHIYIYIVLALISSVFLRSTKIVLRQWCHKGTRRCNLDVHNFIKSHVS